MRRVSWKHETVLVGPQREDRRVGKEGRAQVRDRPTLRGRSRYGQTLLCKQLDERGTLHNQGKAPGKDLKLHKKARKLLVEDLKAGPGATHSQWAGFLCAVLGVTMGEAESAGRWAGSLGGEKV